jgi:hypothetical protein
MIADAGRSISAEQSGRQGKMATEVLYTVLLLAPRQGVPAI